jgi:hypothetical protein
MPASIPRPEKPRAPPVAAVSVRAAPAPGAASAAPAPAGNAPAPPTIPPAAATLPPATPPATAAAAPARAGASPAGDVQLTQRVLADLQRQVELMLEVRLREALAPILARASDALVRDAKKELTAAMRDIVSRSIARELGRREDR